VGADEIDGADGRDTVFDESELELEDPPLEDPPEIADGAELLGASVTVRPPAVELLAVLAMLDCGDGAESTATSRIAPA
jgi:hypothetical protein